MCILYDSFFFLVSSTDTKYNLYIYSINDDDEKLLLKCKYINMNQQ